MAGRAGETESVKCISLVSDRSSSHRIGSDQGPIDPMVKQLERKIVTPSPSG